MAEGEGRARVPAEHCLARNPHLATKAADQIPDLPTVMVLRLVQSRGAVRALRLVGLAVAVAPAEVPVGKGAEPFF